MANSNLELSWIILNVVLVFILIFTEQTNPENSKLTYLKSELFQKILSFKRKDVIYTRKYQIIVKIIIDINILQPHYVKYKQ